MTSSLLFDFTVDKAKKTVFVNREFDADLQLVWDAFTKAEILDQWWAPKPWMSRTKLMDFKVGGRRFYAMVSPEGQEFWSVQEFTSISPITNFKMRDSFSDKDQKINTELTSQWNLNFSEQNGHDGHRGSKVSISITHDTLASLEKILEMGFEGGFRMCLENLDQYIAAQFKLRQQNKASNKTRVTTYLNFPGNTEEAMLFYKSVFKTEFLGKGIERFGDIPQGDGYPPVAEAVKKMVLHAELPIMGNHILMATDAPKEMGFTLTQGNNMHICIEPESREETKRIFDELSAGGNVSMPLQDMFFGSYFGQFTDKFGINWMVNSQNTKS
ncbi:MAG: SRPBCC domain-containing protein [Cyclobacteriaceae bacterium]